jgi:glycogen(starch) synthase
MKVLMIGPASANSSNYGMGVATAQIAQFLASNCELTIVSPTQASEMESSVSKSTLQVQITEGLTDQKQVDAHAVHIQLQSELPAYIYHDEQIKAETTEKGSIKTESIQSQLTTFSKNVVVAVSELAFDVVYAHDWLSIDAAIDLKNKSGKPFILHIHSLDYDRTGKNSRSWIYELEKKGMEQADTVIAVSNYHAEIMTLHYAIPTKKIKVVPLALSKVKDIPYTSPFSEKIVLFSGRLSHQKGVFKFIDIAEALLETESDLRFIVAGAGELSLEVVSLVQEKGLTAYFNFTGRISQEELHALMKHCEIFIMPSVSEPFGLVAIEAAARSLPIVMTKNAGALQLLKSAFVPKEETVAAYVKQIKMVLTNKEKVAEAVKRNQIAVKGRDWQHVGNEILQILNK